MEFIYSLPSAGPQSINPKNKEIKAANLEFMQNPGETQREVPKSHMGRTYVIMGVCGSGKTTIGQALATAINGNFFDGDDYHPQENVAKMRSGQPLDDADRQAWLERLAQLLAQLSLQSGWHFLACSALRDSYRDVLKRADPRLGFIFLHGSKDLLRQRMDQRRGHFMPAGLLDSQFATLEVPKDAISVDVGGGIEEIVRAIVPQLRASP